MTHRTEVEFISINDDLEIIRAKVREAAHSRYPVIDPVSGDVLGAVLIKEILNAPSSPDFSIMPFVREIHALPETTSCLRRLTPSRGPASTWR